MSERAAVQSVRYWRLTMPITNGWLSGSKQEPSNKELKLTREPPSIE